MGRAAGGTGPNPRSLCRVVRGADRPGEPLVAPAAPLPARGRGRHRAGADHRPRACAGVAATPRGAGRFSHAVTKVSELLVGGHMESPPPPLRRHRQPRYPPHPTQSRWRGAETPPPARHPGCDPPPPSPSEPSARPSSLPRPPQRPCMRTEHASHAWPADMQIRQEAIERRHGSP